MDRSKKNYGYVFVFYDVGEKRVGKVFKICKKYLQHHQLSVFRGETTPSKLMRLKKEVCTIIDPEEDHITIIKMLGEYMFDEEIIGTSKKEPEDGLFI